MEGLTEGRIVHFVMNNGEHRPAIVVRVWSVTGKVGYVNLIVFVDGTNDLHPAGFPNAANCPLLWETSVDFSETKEPRTWHWIEKA